MMFVDASAIVAILTREPEAEASLLLPDLQTRSGESALHRLVQQRAVASPAPVLWSRSRARVL